MKSLELRTPYYPYKGKKYYDTLTIDSIDSCDKIWLSIDKTEDTGKDEGKSYNLSIEEAEQIIEFLQEQIKSQNK